MQKQWWKSKTVWFNLITLVLGVVGALLNLIETKAWVLVFTAVMALGNGILRIYFTDTPIAK